MGCVCGQLGLRFVSVVRGLLFAILDVNGRGGVVVLRFLGVNGRVGVVVFRSIIGRGPFVVGTADCAVAVV